MTPEQTAARCLVLNLAQRFGWTPVQDDRPKLWEIAQARASKGDQTRKLMAVLCWLYYKREVKDLAALHRVAQRISLARNPYPYFQAGGRVLESFLGELAVNRNALEATEEKQANLNFLGVPR